MGRTLLQFLGDIADSFYLPYIMCWLTLQMSSEDESVANCNDKMKLAVVVGTAALTLGGVFEAWKWHNCYQEFKPKISSVLQNSLITIIGACLSALGGYAAFSGYPLFLAVYGCRVLVGVLRLRPKSSDPLYLDISAAYCAAVIGIIATCYLLGDEHFIRNCVTALVGTSLLEFCADDIYVVDVYDTNQVTKRKPDTLCIAVAMENSTFKMAFNQDTDTDSRVLAYHNATRNEITHVY